MTRRSSRGRPRSSEGRRPGWSTGSEVAAGSGGTARDFPRTARLNHLVQEIVAEEIERLEDDRLGFLTVVAVDVEPDLRHATVWYTSLSDTLAGPGEPAAGPRGDEGEGGVEAPDPELVEALEEHRPRLQAAIARQARLKRTPELAFTPDPVTLQARRVEAILRDIGAGE
jgi:ribosome-binding factor A